jgi:hypothetical protein
MPKSEAQLRMQQIQDKDGSEIKINKHGFLKMFG